MTLKLRGVVVPTTADIGDNVSNRYHRQSPPEATYINSSDKSVACGE